MNPRESEHWKRRVRHRVVALMVLFLLLALLFFYPHPSSNAFVLAPQGRRPQTQGGRRRRPPQPQPQTGRTGGGRNYARFRHESHRPPVAKLDCNDCHAIRSAAAPDRITAATNPGADGYPYHDSCVQCHRQQFFIGAAPSICTVCHTRSSPRLTARDMRSFPRQSDQSISREFPGYFPHSLHQGVLARRDESERGWSFVRASFTAPDTVQQVDNCAICHLTDERAPEPIKVGGTEATFKPEAKTFKTVPAGHATCFNCHWQSQKPLKDNCAGCHLSQAEYTKRKRAASFEAALPGVLSANAVQWFKTWPQDWPKRLSIKFRHQTTNHDIGCTTCHINITQMETLNIPKADVPIATCAPCHISASPVLRREGGANVTIFSEMADEAKDTDNKSNTCVGCHTSLIGRERPPCSHYQILGQPCPQ